MDSEHKDTWEIVEAAAQQFYNEYGDHASWKNFVGNSMSTWLDLPIEVRDHWLAVAEYAVDRGFLPEGW